MNGQRTEEMKSLLLLNRLPVAARRAARGFLENGVSPAEVLKRVTSQDLKLGREILPRIHSHFDPEQEIENCRLKGVRFVTLLDPEYPPLLRQIPDPPILLYLLGRLEEGDQAAIAIVGSRHPSFYGLEQARRFGRELAHAGLTIVSGLAQGIDRAAHEAAMEVSYGRAIAVLGCGVDIIYPRESREVYERILDRGGALLSEFGLGTKPLAENFPRRNRIISGLSLGVLVVEAHSRSGSLITAHEAVDQGREVFAIPGPVDQLTSRGTHRLLKEGACLVESPLDILEVLALPLQSNVVSPSINHNDVLAEEIEGKQDPTISSGLLDLDFSSEEKGLIDVLSEGPLAYDEMTRRSFLSPAVMASLVTGLELKGRIRKMTDGCFVLAS